MSHLSPEVMDGLASYRLISAPFLSLFKYLFVDLFTIVPKEFDGRSSGSKIMETCKFYMLNRNTCTDVHEKRKKKKRGGREGEAERPFIFSRLTLNMDASQTEQNKNGQGIKAATNGLQRSCVTRRDPRTEVVSPEKEPFSRTCAR